MKRASPEIWHCIGPVVEGLGYEFVGARYGRDDGEPVLRVFIDSVGGVNIDDCSRVSRQLSAVLDVEIDLPGAYNLEVSSPGMERPLFSSADFARFVGEVATVKLLSPLDGRRRFKGAILACGEDHLDLAVDGVNYELPLSRIERADLFPW